MDNHFKPYILLVEDSQVAIIAATAVLSNAACLVDVAKTGAEALKLFHQKKYHLVLMDIGLPDTDGITVTKKIKANKEAAEIPVIALTSHNTEDLKQKCFKAGMVDVLLKPLTTENANNILKKYIGK